LKISVLVTIWNSSWILPIFSGDVFIVTATLADIPGAIYKSLKNTKNSKLTGPGLTILTLQFLV
jgi:hypothetical protein